MKIVIAPDSFKESLSAIDVAAALAEGLRRVLPDAELVQVPMADGGEGTLQALTGAAGARLVEVQVSDALGNATTARYGVLADGRTAVVEIAEAIGLDKVPVPQRSPRVTSSAGVGQLILACLDQGLRHLVVGLGGSATVDGGAGMLQAVGCTFVDAAGFAMTAPLCGGQLHTIAGVDLSTLDPRLAEVRIDIACDVDNPLCGPRGAAAIFGPQKGATAADVVALDRGLRHLYDLLEGAVGFSVAAQPGAGAAGGLGAALLLALNGKLRPGVEVVIEAIGLGEQLRGASLVVTGEGRLDAQTLFGKAPAGVAQLAHSLGIPVVAVGGSLRAVEVLWQSGLFDAVEATVTEPCRLSEALTEARTNLVHAGMRLGMWVALSSRLHLSL